MGAESAERPPDTKDVDAVRKVLAGVIGDTDTQPVEEGDLRTSSRPGILEAWMLAVRDSHDQPTFGCTKGAPTGVSLQITLPGVPE